MNDQRQSPERNPATVLMSGGLDSYACAILFKSQDLSVRGLFIDYGQAAATNEWTAAQNLASQLEIPVCRLSLPTNNAYGAGELMGRNLFLISAAIFMGGAHSGILGIGIHAGTPYADCSTTFFQAASNLIALQSDGRLSLAAPFISWSKLQILQYLQSQGAPVDKVYSCESGTIPPCGSCASCRDREALGC